jgi:hypothetical protein
MTREAIAYAVLAIVMYTLWKEKADCATVSMFIGGMLLFYVLFIQDIEGFATGLAETRKQMCTLLTGRLGEVKRIKEDKCKKLDISENPRASINAATECYNFAGQEIVTGMDTTSWCDLNDSDIKIIDEAAKKLQPEGSDLATYNAVDRFAAI